MLHHFTLIINLGIRYTIKPISTAIIPLSLDNHCGLFDQMVRSTDRCQDAYDESIWSGLRGEHDQVRVGQKIKPGTILLLHSAAWNSCPVQCPAVFKCFKCT